MKFSDSTKNFLTLLMSGTDNKTPAIGRYLGAILFIVFMIVLPSIITGALVLQGVAWSIWQQLFASLSLYVPSVVASITALIRVLDPIEPKLREKDPQ